MNNNIMYNGEDGQWRFYFCVFMIYCTCRATESAAHSKLLPTVNVEMTFICKQNYILHKESFLVVFFFYWS